MTKEQENKLRSIIGNDLYNWLTLESKRRRTMESISITKMFTFDAAHKLPLHKGKCKNLHGHTYKLEVTIEGDIMEHECPEQGMVMDFGNLKNLVKTHIIDQLDHSYLNDHFNNPTAENMAVHIFVVLEEALLNGLGTRLLSLKKIRLWETPTSYAEIKR